MKKIIIPLLIIILIVFAFMALRNKITNDLSQTIIIPSQSPTLVPTMADTSRRITKSLFVPYWTLPDDEIESDQYNELIYFGIKPSDQGIDYSAKEKDLLEDFVSSSPADSVKLLTLQMTNTQQNSQILKNKNLQQKIIDESISIAGENNFQGIVLDLEISAIPFDSLTQQISDFTKSLYKSSKDKNLKLYIALYGDVFYRARPYDVKTLAQNSDAVMIMAYDLHKANGNPGPNFPLSGHDKYGYDYNSMTDDFLKFIPPEKITVIFGVFGYDWKVTEKDQSNSTATALTLSQIDQKFINSCMFSKCSSSRDKDSAETQIRYTDEEGENHIIWFEDLESIKLKQHFLRQKGITSFSYWANTYF